MTLRVRAVKSTRLNLPVSYRVLDLAKLSDARNIFDNKGVQETRYGLKKFNAVSLGSKVLSATFFKHSNNTKYRITKALGVLYNVMATGAHTVLKSGLSTTSKHRGVTTNDRHIIAVENDGLYSFNGTVFTQLGQLPPTGATASVTAGGALAVADYRVGLTFYSSVTGFETNVFESNQVITTIGNNTVTISGIPTSASNGTIDKVRIYLKNVTSNSAYFSIDRPGQSGEVNLGTTSVNITLQPISTLTPPTKNAPPIAGGGKYISIFGKKIMYSGNSTFPSDVFFSEEDLPDAFDSTITQNILNIPGQGGITGQAVGFFDDTHLSPFAVIFKKNSVVVYSELNGVQVQASVDENIGCVCGDSIRVRNGAVYFMSENGWYMIRNGTLLRDKNKQPLSLGNGDIDDVFSRIGWVNELNSANFTNFFSAYYTINSQYMTFISEAGTTTIKKAYVYEEKIAGFRIFEFKSELSCACEGEDDNGFQSVFIGDVTGALFTYSTRNPRHDEDEFGVSKSIPCYLVLSYIQPGEIFNSYNFKYLTLRCLGGINPLTVNAYPNFANQTLETFNFVFPNTSGGFILDVSQLDIASLSDSRAVVVAQADLSLTGETLLLGFYQDVIDGNIGLIDAELSINKNGNHAVGGA